MAKVTVTASPSDDAATLTLKVDDTVVASGRGSVSADIPLTENDTTTIVVRVTAQDASTQQTYTVAVNRAASTVATLSGLEISASGLVPLVPLVPTFFSDTINYTVEVANEVASVTVKPTTTHTGAEVKVNGTEVTSGSASDAIALDVGDNTTTTITVEVTAQDTTTTETYTIEVTRAASDASTVATLSGLTLSAGTLSFFSDTINYTVDVANEVASVTLAASPTDDNATLELEVDDTVVASGRGSVSADIPLTENDTTTIVVRVTAQDASTQQTYTIDVTRFPSSNTGPPELSELKFDRGRLEPPFKPATTKYTLYMEEDTTSVTVPNIEPPNGVTVELRVDGRLLSDDDRTVELNPDRLTIFTITLTRQSTSQLVTQETPDEGTATNTYTIEVVPPWPYFTDTPLSLLTLYTGDEKRTQDAGIAIKGDNLRWTFESSDPTVALVEQDEQDPSVVVVKPGLEGEVMITVTAENDNGTQTLMFPATVITSEAEKTAIRTALSGQARVLLGSVTDMIGERIDSAAGGTGGAGNVCISSAAGADGDRGNSGDAGAATHGSGIGSGDAIATANAWRGDGWNAAPPRGMGLRGVPHVGHRGDDNMDKTFEDLLELFRGRPYSLLLADRAADCGTDAVGDISRPWTLWAGTDLQWAKGGTDDSDFDGEWGFLYLGADRAFSERWLGGLSLSRVWGEVDYSFADASGGGTLSSDLTALYPYLHGQLSANLELWLIGGIGFGDVENEREHVDGHRDQGDLDMSLLSVGLRRSLSQAGSAMDLALTGDAGFVSLSTEGDGSLDGAEASIGRVRLGLEMSRPFASGVEPFAQLHGRYDSGDGPTGAAGEMVLGVRYGGERLNVEVRGNYLTSAADFEQWGANARLDYSPATDGTGLNLALTSQWGAAENGGSFLQGHTMRLPASTVVSELDGSTPAQFSGGIGYGFVMERLPGRLTPNLGYDHSGHGTSRTRIGLAYTLPSDLNRDIELRLDLARTEHRQEAPDHGIKLTAGLRF